MGFGLAQPPPTIRAGAQGSLPPTPASTLAPGQTGQQVLGKGGYGVCSDAGVQGPQVQMEGVEEAGA